MSETGKRPNGPAAWPLLGHVPAFLAGKLEFLTQCAAEYGDTVRLKIGEPTLLLTGAGDIQHVLVGNPGNYSKSPRLTGERGKRLSGAGMQTSIGAEHLKQRRLLQPVFHARVMEKFFELMRERTAERLNGWKDGAEIDLAKEMEALALSIVIASIFGAGYRDVDDRLAKAITIRRAYLEYHYGSLLPFPEYWPAPIVFRYRGALQTIDEIIHAAIDGNPAPGGDSFAAMYAGLRYQDGAPMNRSQLRDEILTLMSTGYETVGDALAWTLYLLALHPDAEATALEEIRTVLGGRPPDPGNVSGLEYLRMVLEESMRLYPPTWIFVRIALGDDRLPGGAIVKAGTKIYLCQYVTHRLAKYFPDPERFDPERFRAGVKQDRPRFSYFPFGGGQRLCIGEQFARQEAAVVLAMLLPRFRCELVVGQQIVPRAGITLRPEHGLRMTVRARA